MLLFLTCHWICAEGSAEDSPCTAGSYRATTSPCSLNSGSPTSGTRFRTDEPKRSLRLAKLHPLSAGQSAAAPRTTTGLPANESLHGDRVIPLAIQTLQGVVLAESRGCQLAALLGNRKEHGGCEGEGETSGKREKSRRFHG